MRRSELISAMLVLLPPEPFTFSGMPSKSQVTSIGGGIPSATQVTLKVSPCLIVKLVPAVPNDGGAIQEKGQDSTLCCYTVV